MNNSSRPYYELPLFALAVFLAFALRFLNLGNHPLSDEEARWAMQAFDLAKGNHPEIGPQPAYVLLTAFIFYIFQASNFAARVLPALAGATLVFAPFFFRDRLGTKASLVLSFALALEPGLLALSRQAGSPIIAVSTLAFAWSFWRVGRLRLAGIMAGLALLSGPALWSGVIAMALTYFIARNILPATDDAYSLSEHQPLLDRTQLTTMGLFAVGTYLAVGSLFLAAPGGLSAGLASLPAYLGGWMPTVDGAPGLHLLIALPVYQFMALILAVIALVRGFRQQDRLIMALGAWFVVALALALIYPSRQVGDLAWALIPLWTLASLEFSRYLDPIREGVWETIGMTALTVAILIFTLFNFLTVAISPLDMAAVGRTFGAIELTNGQIYVGVVIGSLLLLAASAALVAYGWSQDVAFQGVTWGILIALVYYTLSASMGAANLRTYRTVDLWSPGPQTVQADALTRQMSELSLWDVGVPQRLDVFVAGVESPALRWALRDWEVTYSAAPTLTGDPSFVIASDQLEAPTLASGYRGQEFTWRGYPAWESVNWLRWAILQDVTKAPEKIILWTRTSIFIDAKSSQP